MGKLVTKSEFARHIRVDRVAVTRACQRGRLSRALVKDETGHEVLDLEIAEQEWVENCKEHNRSEALHEREAARLSSITPPPVVNPSPTIAASPATPKEMGAAERKRHWDAKKAELQYREAAGELCDKAVFEHRVAELATQFKTRLLGVPSRVKQADPDLTTKQILMIEALIREALSE